MEHACGIFGCIASGIWPSDLSIANLICRSLEGLQHRGQESAGIVTSFGGVNANDMFQHKAHGLVSQIFDEAVFSKLKGNLGVGHTRYSTHGGSGITSIQPFVVDTVHGLLAVAHNGELINSKSLRKSVLKRGVGLSSFSDSELITQTLALSPPENPDDWPKRIRHFMESAPTSYSLVIMHADKLYAVRDPYGNRPLCIGKLNRVVDYVPDSTLSPVGWVVSSESCSFHSIGAELIREIRPGEVVEISRTGFQTLDVVKRPGDSLPALCIFEYVYFARNDSYIEDQMVYSVRENCGRQLAIEAPVEADIVSCVPESAIPSCLGYSRQIGIPFVEVLCKNRYVGRSFIQPSTRLRQLAVARKFGPLGENIKGQRIILIDDSIVRGNTMQPMIALLKRCGAKEIHVRVASPPIRHPCYMGINIPTKTELLANKVEQDKMADYLGATSVVYLSIEGLNKAVTDKANSSEPVGHCTACLSGEYPVALDW